MLAEYRIINTDQSIVFRYAIFIRKIRGCDTDFSTKKFCPFFQATFWLTVITLLFWPIALLGWFLIFAFRKFYVVSEKMGATWITSLFDRMGLGDYLNDQPDLMEKSPLLATTANGIMLGFFFLGIVTIGVATVMILYGAAEWILYTSIYRWREIPSMLALAGLSVFHAAEWVGWGVYNAISFLGQGLLIIGLVVKTISVGVFNWILDLLSSPSAISFFKHLGVFILVSFVVFAAGFVTYKVIHKIPGALKFWNWISIKFNGFTEAREVAKTRRELARERSAPRVKKVKKPKKEKIYTGRSIVSILGSFGVIWTFAKAVYSRACPTIDFISNEDIETAKKAIEAFSVIGEPPSEVYSIEYYFMTYFSPASERQTRSRAAWMIRTEVFSMSPLFVNYLLARYVLGDLSFDGIGREIMNRISIIREENEKQQCKNPAPEV